MKIRSFVAIELPSTTQEEIIWRTTRLRELHPYPVIRWVKLGNIHLTLKFLGDITEKELAILANLIASEAAGEEPFSFSFSNLGIFPNIKRPRIIWIGIESPIRLIEFQRKIEDLTTNLGIPIDNKPFSPHITLGRFGKSNLMLNPGNLFTELDSTIVNSIDTVKITAIKIFQSDLRPDGPVYSVIHNIPLGTTNNQRGKT
ncbi:MAG: RNA 2',3'-cyclic phosphodiesterase [Chloroflexota bacterium]